MFPEIKLQLKIHLQSWLWSKGLNFSRTEPFIVSKLPTVPEHLKRELDTVFEEFARSCNSAGMWSKPKAARAYLSDYRIGQYLDILKNIDNLGIVIEGKRIIDVGTGPGLFLKIISEMYNLYAIQALEPSAEMNNLASKICPQAIVHPNSIFNFSSDRRFDLVFCIQVLEHLVDPFEGLVRLLSLIDDQGYIVITVPDGRRNTLAPYQIYDDGHSYSGHINFWSPESWNYFIKRFSHSNGCQYKTSLTATGNNLAIIYR